MKLQEIKNALELFPQQKVLIIGDIGLDIYTIGDVKRISPEAPVPVFNVQKKIKQLGLAANVANNIKALGAKAYLIGLTGEDENQNLLKEILKEQNITSNFLVSDPARTTILKERITTHQQQIVRIDYEETNPIDEICLNKILRLIDQLDETFQCCILEDYGKGIFTASSTPKIIQHLKKKNIKILLDANRNSAIEWFHGIDLIKPNNDEAQSFSGIKIRSESDYKKIAQKIFEETKSKQLVITRGKEGMSIFTSDGQSSHIPTFAREVFDVTGAGDTVISVLALSLGIGLSLEKACWLANLTAGIEVSKRGSATVSPEELLREAEDFISQ